jgi:hypothetical protein
MSASDKEEADRCAEMARAMCRLNRQLLEQAKQLTETLEGLLPPEKPHPISTFVPNAFQRGILASLEGKALRTDALGHAVRGRSRLFNDPGGLPELQDQGLVCHHRRVGYYRPDAPPEHLKELIDDGD